MTVSETRRAFVWPARHFASDSNDPSLPRMGERLRLSAERRHLALPAQARRVAQAMKTYGLIVADNGSDWFISGVPSRAGTTTSYTPSTCSPGATSRSSTRAGDQPGPRTATSSFVFQPSAARMSFSSAPYSPNATLIGLNVSMFLVRP